MHAYVNALDSTPPRYQGSVPVQKKRRDMCAGMVVAGCPTSFSDMPLQSYQVNPPSFLTLTRPECMPDGNACANNMLLHTEGRSADHALTEMTPPNPQQ